MKATRPSTKQRDYYKEHCRSFAKEIEERDKIPDLTEAEREEFFRKLIEASSAAAEKFAKFGWKSLAHFRAAELNRKFSWSKLSPLLGEIPTLNEKIEFLHHLLSDYKRESRGFAKGKESKPLRFKSGGFLETHPTDKYLEEEFWTFKEDVEIELEKLERLKLLESASGFQDGDEFDPAKRGLTRQLAMMLLDDLFPNLAKASNKSKGEFLSLLTGWNSEGLRNKWSDYRRGNAEALAADLQKVTEWKKKLKIE